MVLKWILLCLCYVSVIARSNWCCYRCRKRRSLAVIPAAAAANGRQISQARSIKFGPTAGRWFRQKWVGTDIPCWPNYYSPLRCHIHFLSKTCLACQHHREVMEMNAGCLLWSQLHQEMCHEPDDQQVAAKCVHQTEEVESVSVVVREPCQCSVSNQPLARGLLVCIVMIYILCFWMELW